jgi:para-nitrobenzyl esterase
MKNSLLIFLLLALPPAIGAQGTLVNTTHGKVQGVQEADGIVSFKGIPFAAPPVGELRWKPPQALSPWDGVLECDAFGPSPIQQEPSPFMFWSSEFLIPKSPISEDCLYLNVWTPKTGANQKKAVLVYIYGGGFQSGGAGCPIYDGFSMAKKDVVFVTLNYRVGRFGFLAHPGLTAESGENTSGNYALLDMIAALRWVRDNIAAFGGDPGNVTIAGQSAGAFAVNYLTVSPLARNLFHKAIAQSGGNFYNRPGRDVPHLGQAENQGLDLGRELGADTVEDLRKLSARKILEANTGSSGPIVDGYVIPETVYETYSRGSQAAIPVLLGWNADDLVFRPDTLDFRTSLKERFGEKAGPFLNAYPHAGTEEAHQSKRKMARDEFFALQGYAWAEIHSATTANTVYVYNFNRALPAYDAESVFGAFHSGEIVYAYNNLQTLDRPWESSDHRLAETMSDYWANFAKTADPNGAGLPLWEAYDPVSKKVMLLDNEIESSKLPDTKQLQVWQDYYEQK